MTPPEVALLDDLGTLYDKSLVQRQVSDQGEERFGMLLVLHEYAREQLQAHGELDDMERRHAIYFRAFAATVATNLWDANPETWLLRLAPEEANLRAALQWSLTVAPVEIALPLAAALGEYWRVSSQWDEGRVWIGRVLQAATAATDSAHYAAALQGRANWLFTRAI